MSEDQFLLSVCDQQSLPAEDFHSVNSEQITVLQLLYYGESCKCEYMYFSSLKCHIHHLEGSTCEIPQAQLCHNLLIHV